MQPRNTTFQTNPSKLPEPALKKRALLVRNIREALAADNLDGAAKHFETTPPKLKNDPEILFLRALIYERRQNLTLALKDAEASYKAHPHTDCALLIARCHRAAGETEECFRWLDIVDQQRPGGERAAITRAGALEAAGRAEEAAEVLRPFIEKYESEGKDLPRVIALEWDKILVQLKRYDEAIELIDYVVEDPNIPAGLKSTQFHLKAKAHDRSKNYDAAAEAATEANKHDKVDYSPDLHTEQVSILVENWSRANMESFPISSCQSQLPVFVAGMPRSGTSLIDQIIDAHPKASGVGELNSIERFAVELSRAYDPEKPVHKRFGKYDNFRWTRVAEDYVKEIKAAAPEGAERVVNKALGNNKLVGLLARLFPNTRVIHAIRDPRDVAISCFMGGFNNRIHAWTTQIDWVAHSWNLSMRMMEHWKNALDIPVLDVHYERLVADPENEMPRIIEFLGLEWDDACRDFYKSKRTVRTLSYDQVNRPLYTSSSGRHKNYASLIEGVDFPDYDPFA